MQRQTGRISLVLTTALLPALLPGELGAQGAVDSEHGVVATVRALRGLGSVKRVLVIGAHPDDEDTSLLAWLERGVGADAAYLALNRGEGGQNLIGPELGVGLGLVRTGELLAARRIDGAEQFFTRAYDFGYSKSAAETFRYWPRDSLLADVVAVVRRFRPQIVVSIFSGTPRDRHGQHQVAGLLAREAFEIAGDSAWFPQQIEAGLRPWTPLKLYRSTRFDRDASTLRIETGTLDQVYGRSYYQIAMASRSQHRSQDMGVIEGLGPRQSTLQLVASRVSDVREDESLFAGVDTTLVGPLSAIPDIGGRRALDRELETYEEHLRSARGALGGWKAGGPAAELAAALRSLRRAVELSQGLDGAEETRFLLRIQESRLETALAEAAGVIVEAFTDDDLVVPGQRLKIEAQIWNGGDQDVRVWGSSAHWPGAARNDRIDPPLPVAAGTMPLPVAAGTMMTHSVEVTIPQEANPTSPYFLRAPRQGAVYVWPASYDERGTPLGTPATRIRIDLTVAGLDVSRELEAVYRFADQARGEVRRPLHAVPAVGLTVEPAISVWPLDRVEPLAFSVTLRSEAPDGVAGRLRLVAPAGWTITPPESPFQLGAPGSATTLEHLVSAPPAVEPGSYTISAVAEIPDGEMFHQGYSIIDYPHIRRSILIHEASAKVEAIELTVDRKLRVGYVLGAGDVGAQAIKSMGIEVDVLDDRTLSTGDLSVYDVLVLGIRTYETNPALLESNGRLLDWVRAGGTLIAQYQQYTYFNGDYAPYPLRAQRPHDRVTDEEAPVVLLEPDHPAFNRPNAIGPSDFEGWVQERGLYFAHEWDERYQPLLATADSGEEAKRGGLLIARVGDGLYVYTGLALFRQLPAGVPGAYRLLANLLSLRG